MTSRACRLLGCLTLNALILTAAPAFGDNSSAFDRAEALLQQGRYADAERLLRPVTGVDGSPRAHYLLGFALVQMLRFEEGERYLREAVAAKPQRDDWLLALGKSLLEQGRNAAAVEIIDRAIAINPQPEYFYAKAMCALNIGDLATAEAALQSCIDGRPHHSDALYQLGRIKVNRGRYAESLELLEASLVANPNNVEARYLLGLAQRHVGDLEAARAAFSVVIDAIPGHVGALYNLGRVLIELGESEQAQRYLERFRAMSKLRDEIDFTTDAVKKNPANLAGRIHLADLLLQVGRAQEALQELMTARSQAPREIRVYDLLGTAFRRLGNERYAQQAEAYAAMLREQMP